MINITNPADCCGCTACASICAHHAINMVPDALGFLYPKVSTDLCVDCGLCEKVCQFNEYYNRFDNNELPQVYGLRLKDDNQLLRSQSGGAFFAMADVFLKKNGIVYGAAFDEKWNVHHVAIYDEKGLEKLRGSKYVQSDLRDVFPKIKEDLKNGKNVLFSGTACQVAGLKSYIPKRLHTNLFCIDIICHGVPSPKVWQDYLLYIEKKYHSKISKVCFRDKRFGWHGAVESFQLACGKELFRQTNNYLYFRGITMRDSCANCKFTNMQRVGDVSVGDFWGISKDSFYEKDSKGYSLVLVNSDKGKSLFSMIQFPCIIETSNTIDCLQPQLQHPSTLSSLHESFIQDFSQKGFAYVAKKYGDIGWTYRRKKLFRRIINKVKRFIGKK